MTIVVHGATGWTGNKVIDAWLAQAGAFDRVPIRFTGRSADKLEALRLRTTARAPHRSVSTRVAGNDAPSLRRAFDGASVVINCVGPYVDAGVAIVRAVIDARAHYIDVSGEESHVAAVYRHDRHAADRGVSICPAFAGKGALGDFGAELCATPAMRARGLDEVAIAYAHGLREATRPSMASILAIAGQGVFRASGFGGALPKRSFGFPAPFRRGLALHVPATEAVSVPRHLDAREVNGYIALAPGHPINEPWARACVAAMPLVPHVAKILFSDWGRWHLELYMQSPETAEDEASFAASIEVRSGPTCERLSILAHDAYGVTADVVAFGVETLLGGNTRAGVLAPSQLCDAATALGELQQRGVVQLFRPRAR